MRQPNEGRRERAKAEKMRRILSAAAALFKEQGFDGTTTQQIADRADVGAGTVFLYVADKSELLLLLFHDALSQRIEAASKALKGKRAFERELVKFVAEILALYLEDLPLSRIFIREMLFHSGQVRKKLDEATGRILSLITERVALEIQAGRFDASIAPETAAMHIYALYHSTLSFCLAECTPADDPIVFFQTMLQSCIRGLLPGTGEKKVN